MRCMKWNDLSLDIIRATLSPAESLDKSRKWREVFINSVDTQLPEQVPGMIQIPVMGGFA